MSRRQHGMTLIELVIAIVVIGICVVSVLSLLTSLSVRSAATMMRTQATSIAASYLENILAQPYTTITAYDGTNHAGAQDATGAALVGMQQYRVQVTAVVGTLGNAPFIAPATHVTVIVTDPTGVVTQLSGSRTSPVGQVLY